MITETAQTQKVKSERVWRMIKLNRICKDYSNGNVINHVLKDVDLQVESGDFIAVMGKSGSGKSTLLNIIGGMDLLSSGEYWYNDIAVHDLSVGALNRFRAEHVGFVFQQFALMTEYTIYENAELPLVAAGVPKGKRRKMTEETLELLGIRHLVDQKASLVSGGEQQRCAIARAMLSNGNLILCDEPTGALDSRNSELIMDCLKKVNELGKTIILVTHDRAMAEYTDKIYYLADGVLSEE